MYDTIRYGIFTCTQKRTGGPAWSSAWHQKQTNSTWCLYLSDTDWGRLHSSSSQDWLSTAAEEHSSTTHGTKARTGSMDGRRMSQILNCPMELTAATSEWVRKHAAFNAQLSAASINTHTKPQSSHTKPQSSHTTPYTQLSAASINTHEKPQSSHTTPQSSHTHRAHSVRHNLYSILEMYMH